MGESRESYDAKVLEWAKYIGDLSKEQLRKGCEWYLSLNDKGLPRPLLFRRRCFGLPDSLMAFEMAKEDKYSHPAVWAAASKVPHRDWKEEKGNLRSRFLMWYEQICESIMNGAVINMPNKPEALGIESLPKYKKRTPEETERGKQELVKLHQIIAEGAAKKEVKGGSLNNL